MPPDESVSHWIHLTKDGDPASAQRLWARYYRRLVALARVNLRGARRRAEDEEDAVLSAFDSFFRGAEEGRFPQLSDRNDLWRLLVKITIRKAADLANREGRLKRGGGRVRGDSALPGSLEEDDRDGWDRFVGTEPTPELAAQAAEECRRLLGRLGDGEMRSVAVWKMEGWSNDEIAARLGCAVPTVERRLRVIRKAWEEEVGEEAAPARSRKGSSY